MLSFFKTRGVGFMGMKDTSSKMCTLLRHIEKDLEKACCGNKAAAQRARTCTIKFEKLAKKFRKESVYECCKLKKKAAPKKKKATKKKTLRSKLSSLTKKKKAATKKRAPAKRAVTRKTTTKRRTTRRTTRGASR